MKQNAKTLAKMAKPPQTPAAMPILAVVLRPDQVATAFSVVVSSLVRSAVLIVELPLVILLVSWSWLS